MGEGRGGGGAAGPERRSGKRERSPLTSVAQVQVPASTPYMG